MPIPFLRLFRRQPAFSRSAVRYACQIEAGLRLTDSDVAYEGRVINLSLGGAMFRPPFAYLMYRSATHIHLTIGDEVITGELVATTPQGFGLRFDKPLEEATLQRLLALGQLAVAKAA